MEFGNPLERGEIYVAKRREATWLKRCKRVRAQGVVGLGEGSEHEGRELTGRIHQQKGVDAAAHAQVVRSRNVTIDKKRRARGGPFEKAHVESRGDLARKGRALGFGHLLCRGQGVFMANKQAEDVARPQRIDRQNGEQATRKIAGKRHDHASKPMGGDGVAHMQAKGLP